MLLRMFRISKNPSDFDETDVTKIQIQLLVYNLREKFVEISQKVAADVHEKSAKKTHPSFLQMVTRSRTGYTPKEQL